MGAYHTRYGFLELPFRARARGRSTPPARAPRPRAASRDRAASHNRAGSRSC